MTKANKSFQRYWLAEVIRTREAPLGPYEDATINRLAIKFGGDLENRILQRAQQIGQREGLTPLLARWQGAALGALSLLVVIAGVCGALATRNALGDGSQSINVLLALLSLITVNTLTLLFWAFSFRTALLGRGSLTGNLWLWLTERLVRSPDAALVPQALLGLFDRQRMSPWLFGLIGHIFWSVFFLLAVVALLVLFSAQRHTFNWESTIITPDTFASLIRGLGWLPAQLGFPVPSADYIRLSDGLHPLPAEAHLAWAYWLIGGVVVYALLPRLIVLVASLLVIRQRLRHLQLDTQLPGYSELASLLMPASEDTGSDKPPEQDHLADKLQRTPATRASRRLLAGLELPASHWPPASVAAADLDLLKVDDIESRTALIHRLQDQPASQLLFYCDANQTPDRGMINLIHETSGLADQTAILVTPSQPQGNLRTELWFRRLQDAGFSRTQLFDDPAVALHWLQQGEAPHAP